MLGPLAFMASGIGACVLRCTDTAIDPVLAHDGAFVGAVRYSVGAWLMTPAWKREAERLSRADPGPDPPAM